MGVDPAEVTAPPWIQDLPRDHRGFLVPAETPWQDGVALLSKMGTERRLALSLARSCAVCGFPIHPDRRGYRLHSQGDAAQVRLYEHDHSQDLGPPGHKSCMLFSAFACTYFRVSTSRMGKDSTLGPGKRRGKLVALFGFESSSLLVPATPVDLFGPSAPASYYDYLGLVEDIKFHEAPELLPGYDAAVADDEQWVDMEAPRAFWTDSPEDTEALTAYLKRWHAVIRRIKPAYEFPRLLDGGRYLGYPLPLG